MTKLKKGGALKGSALDTIEHNSISDTEIRHYLPKALILTYPELKDYTPIYGYHAIIAYYWFLFYIALSGFGRFRALDLFEAVQRRDIGIL